ncbi:MAG: PIN domain nuclease [Deltaproteobacteria bacterium]|nr:PIN domain nuclease [Deltaproteobacteria bacterium]
MILVDTSILIDLFKGASNTPANQMREILRHHVPFGITSVIYQELLQGAKSEEEYTLLNDYLSSQRFFHPRNSVESYADAARIYFLCRTKGVTIRSTIDCLIAQIALEQDLLLLHNDRDFDAMAPIIGLRLLL